MTTLKLLERITCSVQPVYCCERPFLLFKLCLDSDLSGKNSLVLNFYCFLAVGTVVVKLEHFKCIANKQTDRQTDTTSIVTLTHELILSNLISYYFPRKETY